MSLIDRTYFTGQLLVPNALIGDGPVAPVLDDFIAKYEPRFLRYALGFELYKALRDDLATSPIEPRFIDLLQGIDYTIGNRLFNWRGLVESPGNALNAFDSLGAVPVTVGGPQVNGAGQLVDPVAGGITAIIPDGFVGKKFSITQRGLGELIPPPLVNAEYSINGNVLTLLNSVFGNGNVYFYKTATVALNTSPGSGKQSIIANYVYYWYMRDNATQTSAMGEVITENENSRWVSPGEKMSRAMSELWRIMISELAPYLVNHTSLYPEWNAGQLYVWHNHFGHVNELGI